MMLSSPLYRFGRAMHGGSGNMRPPARPDGGLRPPHLRFQSAARAASDPPDPPPDPPPTPRRTPEKYICFISLICFLC